MGSRIQSRIAKLISECIPVYDWSVGYENQLRHCYKAFGSSLPSRILNFFYNSIVKEGVLTS